MYKGIELAPLRQPEVSDIRRLMASLNREVVNDRRYATVPDGMRSDRAHRSSRGYMHGLTEVLNGSFGQAGNLSQLEPQGTTFQTINPDDIQVKPLERPLTQDDILQLLDRYRTNLEALFEVGGDGGLGERNTEIYFSGISVAFRRALEITGQGVTAVRLDSNTLDEIDQRSKRRKLVI